MKNKSTKLILGPMAGVTDLPFRMLCREFGADEVVTEMVSAKAIYYKNKNTEALLRSDPREMPVRVQLFGSDPEICADMALRLEEMNCWSAIDFNMGCPVPKIVNNGEGSALMKDELLAGKIIEAMAKKLSIPVTVKIRAGFDKNHKNAPAFAKTLEHAGASEITVHGRTREEYYGGKADLDIIKAVKEAVSIPVCGNGDIVDAESAEHMLEYTGCDSLMIARGALGRPYIFGTIGSGPNVPLVDNFTTTAHLSTVGTLGPDPIVPPAVPLRDLILRHLQMEVEYNGEFMAIREMRKHIAWYTQGLAGSAAFRNNINQIEELSELKEYIVKYFEKLA